MSLGQGNILVQQRKEIAGPPGPPFLLTSANNGLSVDPITGKIVYGDSTGAGGPAALLSDRKIEFSNLFEFVYSDSVNSQTLQTRPGSLILIDSGVATSANITARGNISLGGNLVSGGNPAQIVIQTNSGSTDPSYEITSTGDQLIINEVNGGFLPFGNEFLSIDRPNGLYQFGNIPSNAIANNSLVIDDANNLIQFFNAAIPNGLVLNYSTKNYRLGNVTGVGFQNIVEVDDNNNAIRTYSSGSPNGLELSFFGGSYRFGDFVGLGNNSRLEIDDAGKRAMLFVDNATKLLLDKGVGSYKFGDVATNNYIEITVGVNQTLMLRNAGAIAGDGVILDPFLSPGLAISMFKANATLTNHAGAAVGTLNNAPAAGNPTKWISINDNGTVRKIPTWL